MPEQDALAAWRAIPETLGDAVSQLDDDALDRRCEKPGMTVRELVHHLVEAQVVASSIVVAGLGSPGSTFDWSWMQPFGPWMERLPYRTLPLATSLEALRGLNGWVAAVVSALDDGLAREVQLRDAPDAELRTATIAEVLQTEVDHVNEHLADIRAALGS